MALVRGVVEELVNWLQRERGGESNILVPALDSQRQLLSHKDSSFCSLGHAVVGGRLRGQAKPSVAVACTLWFGRVVRLLIRTPLSRVLLVVCDSDHRSHYIPVFPCKPTQALNMKLVR